MCYRDFGHCEMSYQNTCVLISIFSQSINQFSVTSFVIFAPNRGFHRRFDIASSFIESTKNSQKMASNDLSSNERFMSFNEQDVDVFIEEEENENTKRKTKDDIALFTTFLQSENESRHLEEMPPLTRFRFLHQQIYSIRKKTKR